LGVPETNDHHIMRWDDHNYPLLISPSD
jgi:hypothetical protein